MSLAEWGNLPSESIKNESTLADGMIPGLWLNLAKIQLQ